jgi:hypothetical protein
VSIIPNDFSQAERLFGGLLIYLLLVHCGGVFYAGSSDCVASNERVISEHGNNKVVEGSESGLIWGTIPIFS